LNAGPQSDLLFYGSYFIKKPSVDNSDVRKKGRPDSF
jgi:hypothetical protein